MINEDQIIDELLDSFPEIRYMAIYGHQKLVSKQRDQMIDSSSSDSDKYEELLINPVLLTAARQRGNIDCGGLRFLIIAYGNFYQLIKETQNGHISICLDKQANLTQMPDTIFKFLKLKYSEIF